MLDCGFTRAAQVPAAGADGAEFALERLADVGVLVRMVDLKFVGDDPTKERTTEEYAPLAGSDLWKRLPAVSGGRPVDLTDLRKWRRGS